MGRVPIVARAGNEAFVLVQGVDPVSPFRLSQQHLAVDGSAGYEHHLDRHRGPPKIRHSTTAGVSMRNPFRPSRVRVALAGMAGLIAMTALPAQALTRIFEGDVLAGADSVDVQGTLLDVRFYDGSCVAVFTGCDEGDDFLFGSMGSPTPRDAARSLTREVLGRNSDIQSPYIGPVLGCTDVFNCDFIAPYSIDARRQVVSGIAAVNKVSSYGFTVTALSSTLDTSTLDDEVYARWSLSPIPEPSPAALMLVGLLALGHRRLSAKWFGVGLRGRRGAEHTPYRA